MGFRVADRNPVFLDDSIGPDQRRRTNRPFDSFALRVLPWPPGAVDLHHADLRVGKEDERQIELGDKLVMRIDAVSTDTDNNSIGFRDRFDSVAEPARFLGSARSIVLGIKPEHDVLTGVIAQRMLFAVAALQGKCRRLFSFQTCHYAPPSDVRYRAPLSTIPMKYVSNVSGDIRRC
jgi:hypothetical protein